jgi:catechol 2,3-dioxygenase-like lactoylglutathione lyase family enzyme
MAQGAKFAHVNIVARDWRRLARFYRDAFGCGLVPPERRQSGEWLERGTGVPGARLEGVHLRLPGHGRGGPTLEIYQYAEMPEAPAAANRPGLGHLAFAVDDVERALHALIGHGGREVGSVVTTQVAGAGEITFVYAADPEGNLIELQSWKRGPEA